MSLRGDAEERPVFRTYITPRADLPAARLVRHQTQRVHVGCPYDNARAARDEALGDRDELGILAGELVVDEPSLLRNLARDASATEAERQRTLREG